MRRESVKVKGKRIMELLTEVKEMKEGDRAKVKGEREGKEEGKE